MVLSLSGPEAYKGVLLLAEVDGSPAGVWGTPLPEGLQPHPHCKHAVTHDTAHVGGLTTDAVPWVVPEGLAPGTRVVFRATVVREYATWFAFERTYVVGSDEGGGGGGGGGDGGGGNDGGRATEVVKGEEGEEAAPRRGDGGEARGAGEEAGAAGGGAGGGGAGGDADEHPPRAPPSKQRLSSADAASLAARRRSLRLLHGCSMGIAWLVLAPAGALAARAFKHLGPVWYDAHRALQFGCVGATLFGVALVMGVLRSRGAGTHGAIGKALALAALVQPVNALLRPDKGAGAKRAAWKRLHGALGWGCVAAGVLNCLLGIDLLVAMEGLRAPPLYALAAATALVPVGGAALAARRGGRAGLPVSKRV